MLGFEPDLRPSTADDEAWSGEFESFHGLKREPDKAVAKRLREGQAYPEDESFDDTFKVREAYLRECGMKEADNSGDNPRFNRGVPTNNRSSAQNYKSSHVKVIDGEHKTLLSVGEINEAMEDDDDPAHIAEHRLMLADSNLNEAQRRALLAHIKSHVKNQGKKLKAVSEAKLNVRGEGYRRGLGVMSKAKTKVSKDDQIPQDDPQSAVRKRTAGMIAMESRINRFRQASARVGRRA